MSGYGRYSAEEIEAQYNLRARRPDYDSKVVPGWIERSEQARARLKGEENVVYGSGPKQKLDIFSAGAPDAPVLIYLHGGYWQRGDKSVYSFLAESFVRNGVSVIVAGYDLCPDVSITRITQEIREALIWIWRHAGEHRLSRERLVVMGHSAGGQLTGRMMGTDWPSVGDDLPRDLIKAGIPISALNLLEPLRYTSINDAVGMDAAEAEAQSPMNHPPLTDAPQLVVCGGLETDEFHRQSDIYVAAFATGQRKLERYSVPDCDHFDELNALAQEDSTFFQKSLALVIGH